MTEHRTGLLTWFQEPASAMPAGATRHLAGRNARPAVSIAPANCRQVQQKTKDLAARLDAHREGRGARLMEVVKQAGGTFRLARTWPGDRARERAIKDRKEASKLCPECSPHPRPVDHGRSATIPPPAVPAPRPAPEAPPVDYYARGTGMARQFLAAQLATGRTADQIAATHDYITGPWRAADHHKPAQAETYRGYADHVAQQLMQLRAGEATTPQADDSQQLQMEAGA